MRVVLDIKKLQQIQRQSGTKADAIVQKIAQDCEAYIKENFNTESPAPPGEAPGVDTGALKNSIIAEPGEKKGEWILHDGVEYGIMLEYGTAKMGAHPFFLPGIEITVNKIPNGLLQEIIE